ncbi:hypothetical protein BT67DRAFT_12315 [Trichocladium antarcticum]|uniref:Secreted protein n=1 Tax=Trichocladium antarcticum TaxID=1450529 RepID=A0AAN6UVC3_9PEZI|nr:hypothetical protein BT67DRAFT_12315 [Trichocladium antarcticum]
MPLPARNRLRHFSSLLLSIFFCLSVVGPTSALCCVYYGLVIKRRRLGKEAKTPGGEDTTWALFWRVGGMKQHDTILYIA